MTAISLTKSPKGYTLDQDKAVTPEETLARVRARLANLDISVLAETRRIDTGRLGIPVYLSVCGEDARRVMPTRKQMGKGATAAQAETSALMELMERYGFFTFWERMLHEAHNTPPHEAAASGKALYATWDEAERLFGADIMPISHVVAACHDTLPESLARRVLNLKRWLFVPALCLAEPGKADFGPQHVKERRIPLDLFKALGEFNGSSAGNGDAESLLQGVSELVERHVCCLADKNEPELPTIDASSVHDPVVQNLLKAFFDNGVTVLLKDFSQGMPLPTVAALAYDPANFPGRSEIVFTAGTASSPAKAAARALTEVAQLAGDFTTAACYEASGLPKYAALVQADWLRKGPLTRLDALPNLEAPDMLDELFAAARGLAERGFPLYALATTNSDTGVPSHYSIAPGLLFRERDNNASLGLFAGRLICEEEEPKNALRALDELEDIYAGGHGKAKQQKGSAHFVPFFRGMVFLQAGDTARARTCFAEAGHNQPDNEARALCAFYAGYALTLEKDWAAALPDLQRAVALGPDMKEYRNLYGVALFKEGRYAEGAAEFADIVVRLDRGSATDWQNLGLCRKYMGDAAGARQALTAALAIDAGLEAARGHLEDLGKAG